MEQKILTVKEAAAIMRVSPSAMYQLVRENKAPPTSALESARSFPPLNSISGWIAA